MNRKKLFAVVALAGACHGVSVATAAPFSTTGKNLAVVRLGDGSAPLSGGVKFFVDEYDLSGVSPVLINTVAVPPTVTLPAIANHDGLLHRSTNGQYLTFAAYGASPAATDPSTLPS